MVLSKLTDNERDPNYIVLSLPNDQTKHDFAFIFILAENIPLIFLIVDLFIYYFFRHKCDWVWIAN